MPNYHKVEQSEYAKLIAYYTWVAETNTEEKYHFSDNTPGTYLDVDNHQLNLFITDDFYKENRMASYKIEIIDDVAYLSMGVIKYIIKYIENDPESLTAKMKLAIIHNDFPFIYLGFRGNFNDSIFKR